MSSQYLSEPMLEMFIFETTQLLEQLEQEIISSEKCCCYTQEAINEIFRIMHTIKGTAAMMLFNNISALAHSIEDLFYFLREENPKDINCSTLCDLVLEGIDFIKAEIEKIKSGDDAEGDASTLIAANKDFLTRLKQVSLPSGAAETKPQAISDMQEFGIFTLPQTNTFKAIIHFAEGCEMENIRALSLIRNLENIANEIRYLPQNIADSDASQIIRQEGFTVYLKTDCFYEEVHQFLMQAEFIKELELDFLDSDEELRQLRNSAKEEGGKIPKKDRSDSANEQTNKGQGEKDLQVVSVQQSIISVNVAKLDKLMDLMGEMVIAEAMVTQNPDLKGLELDNFQKAARQLHKITSELQDVVMSIRMVPLSATFQKMHRVVRDMSKKLEKEVELKIVGEETEVDKNIIEHISDPLMHLVRNSIDHGLEAAEDRQAAGKPPLGRITLEAKNAGSDVLIIVKDDGRGLDKAKILAKARENRLIHKPESEMTDREIYNLILLPGFSTKESITEFSGRGVGMDVVTKNIESVGGSVAVDSAEGFGTTVIIKIPLTLAIIDGMNISVGNSRYTIPTISIRESFRPKETDIIKDPDDNEMIMVRGMCYPLLRLHQMYGVETEITKFTEGILIMVEQDDRTVCLFADKLLGQQQVVVKALPSYIRNEWKIRGLAGCTLLGDGSISLILDIAGLTGLGNTA